VSPLLFSDSDLAALPALLIECGECEVLLDQIVAFADKCSGLGVSVALNVRADMVHVFPLLCFTGVPQIADTFTAITTFMITNSVNEQTQASEVRLEDGSHDLLTPPPLPDEVPKFTQSQTPLTSNPCQLLLNQVLLRSPVVPPLLVALPVASKGVSSSLLHLEEFTVFFVCSHTLRVVSGGRQGTGFRVSATHEWAYRAAPLMEIGLLVLQLQLAKNPSAGVIVPNVLDSSYEPQMHYLRSCHAAIQRYLLTKKLELESPLAYVGADLSVDGLQTSLSAFVAKLQPWDMDAACQAIKEKIAPDDIANYGGMKKIAHKEGVTWIAYDKSIEGDFYENGYVPRASAAILLDLD
jgi:hypothetical protein